MSDPDVSDDGYWFGRAEAAIKRCGALRKELAEKDAEIERLREALKPFGEFADHYEAFCDDEILPDEDLIDVPVGDGTLALHKLEWSAFLNARSALSTPKESLPVEEGK